MKSDSASDYIEPALLGLIAAMRTWTPITVASFRFARQRHNELKGTPLALLGSSLTTTAAAAIAATELVADKTPFIINRTHPAAWGARTLSGVVAGAAWAHGSDSTKRMVIGGLLGGTTAAVGTYMFYHLRRTGARSLSVPDALLGVVEDALAIGIGLTLLIRHIRR